MSFSTSKIALGTVQFGLDYGISNNSGKTPLNEVQKVLALANEIGIDTLDTAQAYGNSEEVLGKNVIKNFKIVSKFINIQDGNDLVDQLNKSLLNLKSQCLYAYLAHRPLELVSRPNIWKKLIDLKESNKIQKIGFSFNTIEEVNQVLRAGFKPDLIQIPYNYLDNRFEYFASKMKDNFQTEIHTRSTFLQGLFFIPPSELNAFFDPIKHILGKINNDNLPAQLLNYVIKNPLIDKVVLGVNSSHQLSENISFLKASVSMLPEMITEIPDEILTPSKWPQKRN